MNNSFEFTELLYIAGGFVAILGGAVSTYLVGYKRGLKKAKSKYRNETLEKRHDLLYAPMYTLFTTRHITSCSSTLMPYFRMRFKAFTEQIKRKRLRYGFKVLLDKKKTKETAEVEFGGGFPLTEIKQILLSNVAYADEKLVNLFRQADRSKYESSRTHHDLLTDEEFALFLHIAETYSKLNRIFV